MPGRSWWPRVAVAAVLLLLGAGVAVLAVAVHALVVGLLLAVVATSATAAAIPGGWHTRLMFCLGWVAVVYVAARPRPGGGYLVGANASGYVLLGFGVLLLLFGTTTVRRPSPRLDS